MIGYRDMTFCREFLCARFGAGADKCPRSLTGEVQRKAELWWGRGNRRKGKGAPIAVFAEQPDCYQEQEDVK